MDITTLSVAQLRKLQQDIPDEIKRRAVREKKDVLDELKSLAESRGYSLDDLLGKRKEPRKRSAAIVKYRHPENSSLQWTGRGRKPLWVEAWLASGRALEALAV